MPDTPDRPRPPDSASHWIHSYDVRLRPGEDLIHVWHSTVSPDENWDTFLRHAHLGAFEQTSFWARFKATDGWQCFRVILTNSQNVIGGFQILWRTSRFGRIGYITHGPVLAVEDPLVIKSTVNLIRQTSKELNLRALVVQPPSESRLIPDFFPKNQFIPNNLLPLISATVLIDVADGIEAVESRMRKTTRKQIRRALQAGVHVRQGNETDIPLFFRMMLETCARQNVHPNPATENAISNLWASAHGSGSCRLTIAECEGRPVSGLFCIPFGNKVTLWKKGSLSEYLYLNSMQVLYREAFEWAYSNGFRVCDLGDMERRVAVCMEQGQPIPEELKKTRYFFKLGFGGKPLLFPEAYFHFPNKLLFTAFRLATKNRIGRQCIKKLRIG